MREPRPADWATDLDGRHALEVRMASALSRRPQLSLLKKATTSLDHLDYAVAGPGDRLGQVELKAKHQPYRGARVHTSSLDSACAPAPLATSPRRAHNPKATPTQRAAAPSASKMPLCDPGVALAAVGSAWLRRDC